jgi:hypothetical protein
MVKIIFRNLRRRKTPIAWVFNHGIWSGNLHSLRYSNWTLNKLAEEWAYYTHRNTDIEYMLVTYWSLTTFLKWITINGLNFRPVPQPRWELAAWVTVSQFPLNSLLLLGQGRHYSQRFTSFFNNLSTAVNLWDIGKLNCYATVAPKQLLLLSLLLCIRCSTCNMKWKWYIG